MNKPTSRYYYLTHHKDHHITSGIKLLNEKFKISSGDLLKAKLAEELVKQTKVYSQKISDERNHQERLL